jgi:hypothetical protein
MGTDLGVGNIANMLSSLSYPQHVEESRAIVHSTFLLIPQ